jgi:hypothetical protein
MVEQHCPGDEMIPAAGAAGLQLGRGFNRCRHLRQFVDFPVVILQPSTVRFTNDV